MTMPSIAFAVSSVLLALAGLHVYWAMIGGTGASVVPTIDEVPVFQPSRASTWVVALALTSAALIVSQRAHLGVAFLPPWIAQAGTWLVAVAFLGRAFGDFRLVGFTKRIKGSRFAYLDTWFYSPLCTGIGLASVAVAAS